MVFKVKNLIYIALLIPNSVYGMRGISGVRGFSMPHDPFPKPTPLVTQVYQTHGYRSPEYFRRVAPLYENELKQSEYISGSIKVAGLALGMGVAGVGYLINHYGLIDGMRADTKSRACPELNLKLFLQEIETHEKRTKLIAELCKDKAVLQDYIDFSLKNFTHETAALRNFQAFLLELCKVKQELVHPLMNLISNSLVVCASTSEGESLIAYCIRYCVEQKTEKCDAALLQLGTAAQKNFVPLLARDSCGTRVLSHLISQSPSAAALLLQTCIAGLKREQKAKQLLDINNFFSVLEDLTAWGGTMPISAEDSSSIVRNVCANARTCAWSSGHHLVDFLRGQGIEGSAFSDVIVKAIIGRETTVLKNMSAALTAALMNILQDSDLVLIIDAALANMSITCHSEGIAYLVASVLKKGSPLGPDIVRNVCEQFSQIGKCPYGPTLVKACMDPAFAITRELIKKLPTTFSTLSVATIDCISIEVYHNYSSARSSSATSDCITQRAYDVKQLFATALDNIGIACKSDRLVVVMVELFKTHEASIMQSVMDNFSEVAKTKYGFRLIERCIQSDPSLAAIFAEKLTQEFDMVNFKTVEAVMKVSSCNYSIKKELLKQEENLRKALMLVAYNTTCGTDSCKLSTFFKSPTNRHIQLMENDSLVQCYQQARPVDFLHDSRLTELASNVVAQELTLQDMYYTFVHGQRKGYLLKEQLHTLLKNMSHSRVIQHNDFLYLHVGNMKLAHGEQKKLRKELIVRGLNYGDDKIFEVQRKHVLYANSSLFGNIDNPGSSSAWYVMHDQNAGNVVIDFKTVFSLHGYTHLYKKYKNKLINLENKLSELTPYGICMLIAVPKATIAKHVFAPKIAQFVDGTVTKNIELIMKTLKTAPETIVDSGNLEFCIAMTEDKYGGLNHNSGIKILPHAAADPVAFAAWKAEVDNVFLEIKADIEVSTSIALGTTV